MKAAAIRPLLLEDFLAGERLAEFRSEYLDGELVALAGASWRHSVVTGNLFRTLGSQLRGTDCRPHGSDLRVWVPATRHIMYPDLVVTCGEPRFLDGQLDTLLNPVMIVEVLSPSTAAYDRTKQLSSYLQLDSLRELLLVEQQAPGVERHWRSAAGRWSVEEFDRREDCVRLSSVIAELTLAEIYEDLAD